MIDKRLEEEEFLEEEQFLLGKCPTAHRPPSLTVMPTKTSAELEVNLTQLPE